MPSKPSKAKGARKRPRKAVKRRDAHAASLADPRYRARVVPLKAKRRKAELGFEHEIDDAKSKDADD